jgi:signal transduction histidine kinase
MGVLLLAVLAGIGLGSYLAVTIGRPVGQVTEAINTLTQGELHTRLPERGPQEMRVLTRSVNTLVERLISLEQARRQLLANLVHELGRPLGALHSAIRALQKGADRDPQLGKDLLNGMDAQTLRLQRLLDDLAGLYDQVLGPLELNRQVIVVQEWLPAVLVPWEAAAKEKGLGWQVQLADALPDLLADPDRLAQAIGNLCSNAVKFTPNGGQVTVQTGADQERFWIQVKDNGPGILPQDQGKVFEPFFRGPHDRRIRQGMGLGLTIARDIINAHQGEIEMHSEPGIGSEFTIYLPL